MKRNKDHARFYYAVPIANYAITLFCGMVIGFASAVFIGSIFYHATGKNLFSESSSNLYLAKWCKGDENPATDNCDILGSGSGG